MDKAGRFCEPEDCDRWWWSALRPVRAAREALGWDGTSAERTASHNARASAGDMQALRRNYDILRGMPEVVALHSAAGAVVATWDDHDYGRNDAGASFKWAAASRELFLSFWRGGDGAAAARGARGGVHEASVHPVGALAVQVILLDTRSWRSDLVTAADAPAGSRCLIGLGQPSDPLAGYGPYCTMAPESALLGEEQWAWLGEQLRAPADLRVIGSPIGVVAQAHGWESWALFPHERRRLVALIHAAKASGVLLISGDIHYGEISVLRPTPAPAPAPLGGERSQDGGAAAGPALAGGPPRSRHAPAGTDADADWLGGGLYPLYDATSSALTHTEAWPTPPLPNARRLSVPSTMDNFGSVTVERGVPDPEVEVSLLNARGVPGAAVRLRLSELAYTA
jgi:hypothetical protein